MLPAPDLLTRKDAKLPHPFTMGSVASIVLGTIALYIEMQNLNSFQWAWAATIGAFLVFGYFPITLVVSPLIMAIAMEQRYRNARGIWRYFGGSAIFGLVYSFFIWGLLFLGFVLSGPP